MLTHIPIYAIYRISPLKVKAYLSISLSPQGKNNKTKQKNKKKNQKNPQLVATDY